MMILSIDTDGRFVYPPARGQPHRAHPRALARPDGDQNGVYLNVDGGWLAE